jgi:hypothetical protein
MKNLIIKLIVWFRSDLAWDDIVVFKHRVRFNVHHAINQIVEAFERLASKL